MLLGDIKIVLASPRGFCAGVKRAIDCLDLALINNGTPLYVRHAIVHNRVVVENFENKGVIFVGDLDDVPDGANVVLSAHGSPKSVFDEAKRRNMRVIDATCPLVSSVHLSAKRLEKSGCSIVLIGHKSHQEVIGTVGQVDGEVIIIENAEDVDLINVADPNKIGYITQTTLNLDEVHDVISRLKLRFPKIIGPESGNICYATKNRQDAAKSVAERVELMLIIGSMESSNSNRLRDVCAYYTTAKLIDSYKGIESEWLSGVSSIGISAGASAPEFLIEEMINYFKSIAKSVQIEAIVAAEEAISFPLPKM